MKLPTHLISGISSTQPAQVSYARIDGKWTLTASISDDDLEDFKKFITQELKETEMVILKEAYSGLLITAYNYQRHLKERLEIAEKTGSGREVDYWEEKIAKVDITIKEHQIIFKEQDK